MRGDAYSVVSPCKTRCASGEDDDGNGDNDNDADGDDDEHDDDGNDDGDRKEDEGEGSFLRGVPKENNTHSGSMENLPKIAQMQPRDIPKRPGCY